MYPDYFIQKETALNIALNKVKNRLDNYLSTPNVEHPDWNNWHDLQYRIECRLFENWKRYKEWHWDKYQFNTY